MRTALSTVGLAGGTYEELAIPVAGLAIPAAAVMVLYAVTMSSLLTAFVAFALTLAIAALSFVNAGFQLHHAPDIDPDINSWNTSLVQIFWSSVIVSIFAGSAVAWLLSRRLSAPNQPLQLTSDARES